MCLNEKQKRCLKQTLCHFFRRAVLFSGWLKGQDPPCKQYPAPDSRGGSVSIQVVLGRTWRQKELVTTEVRSRSAKMWGILTSKWTKSRYDNDSGTQLVNINVIFKIAWLPHKPNVLLLHFIVSKTYIYRRRFFFPQSEAAW